MSGSEVKNMCRLTVNCNRSGDSSNQNYSCMAVFMKHLIPICGKGFTCRTHVKMATNKNADKHRSHNGDITA